MDIEYNKNYDPKDLSAKVSCTNMSMLADREIKQNNLIFCNHFNYEHCQKYHDWNNNVSDIKLYEHKLLRGFSINKKSCIYKRPDYGEGDWSKYFPNSLEEYPGMFDSHTKAKMNDFAVCDYSKFSPPESCNKGPYNLYTKNFSNDYYNCVI
ncbi:hypothetical protein [Flavobacterium sp.]|jgi:hypothetical protein|uniref:hypothetical protein n=1 Tax=Flavobacterium sp. TaxID=239 RepID=UPI0037BEC174